MSAKKGITKAKSVRKPKKTPRIPLLQKRHTNDIAKAVQSAGLDPRQFDLKDSGTEAQFKHKWSASRFTIGGGAGHYVGQRLVGDSPVAWAYKVYSWQTLMERLSTWLQDVKRDLDTPDLWAELQRETKRLGAGSTEPIENTPFTPDEQKEIAGRLAELAKSLSHTYALSQAQMQTLDERVEYLVQASGRLGKKDWFNTFIGVILSFVLSAALAPESARNIFLSSLRAIGLLYPELPLIE